MDRAYDNLHLLRGGTVRGNLTERSRRLLDKIAPPLLQELFESPDPDMALANLERFLAVVGAPLLLLCPAGRKPRNPASCWSSLFGMSEFLSKILIGHPELLDSMVARTYASMQKPREVMAEELASLLQQAEDFEERLDVLRRYRNEEFLRIGLNDIHGKLGQGEHHHPADRPGRGLPGSGLSAWPSASCPALAAHAGR